MPDREVESRQARAGRTLAPIFFLNLHANEAFTRCPRCKAKTRVRKMALVVHVDSVGLVLLRKTCRLCVVCEMLIAHEGEMDRLIDSLRITESEGASTWSSAHLSRGHGVKASPAA